MAVRRLVLLIALALGLALPGHAADPKKIPKVKVGVLKLSSSAPVFIGVEVVAITAQYTEATPEVIRVGFPYQDRDARLDVPDIARQLAWYHKAGMVTRSLAPRDLVDASVLEEALRALPR